MVAPHLQAVKGDPWVGEPDAPPTPPRIGTDAAGAGSAPPSSPSTGRTQKQRAERSLPTDRLSFDKQVEVLRVIAQLSGSNRRPITAEDLSAAIGLKGGTGGLSNKFFRDSGWVVSAGRGMYAATEPLIEYSRHLNVDPQDSAGARRYLAGPAMASWYWETLEPMLDGGARQTMILHALSKAAGAYEHKPQLLLIVTWLEWLGLVRSDGELVMRGLAEGNAINRPESEGTGESMAMDNHADAPSSAALDYPDVGATDGAEEAQPAGAEHPAIDPSALISFSFNVRITADDAAKLNAEQLQSLLDFAEKLRG